MEWCLLHSSQRYYFLLSLSLFRWLNVELLWRRSQCTTDPSSTSLSQVLAGLPLPLFPAVITWMMVFSRLLIVSDDVTKMFHLHFPHLFTSIGFVLNCSKIQALVLCCRHDTRSSRRYVNISNASIFLVTFFEYAHDSHPYYGNSEGGGSGYA